MLGGNGLMVLLQSSWLSTVVSVTVHSMSWLTLLRENTLTDSGLACQPQNEPALNPPHISRMFEITGMLKIENK